MVHFNIFSACTGGRKHSEILCDSRRFLCTAVVWRLPMEYGLYLPTGPYARKQTKLDP